MFGGRRASGRPLRGIGRWSFLWSLEGRQRGAERAAKLQEEELGTTRERKAAWKGFGNVIVISAKRCALAAFDFVSQRSYLAPFSTPVHSTERMKVAADTSAMSKLNGVAVSKQYNDFVDFQCFAVILQAATKEGQNKNVQDCSRADHCQIRTCINRTPDT